ncbi:MAG TPA: histidine kinase [Nocardioides sp.]|nr:histidine kinase [Nocardioides sp.]
MRGIRGSAALLVAGSAVAGVVVAMAVTDSRASFDDLVIVLAVAAYAVVGVAVELARPGHPVGRLMLVGAWTWGVGEGLLALGIAVLDEGPGSVAAALIGVLGSAMRGFGWLVLVLALPLVFPDGRSPSRAATRLVWAAVTAFTVASLAAPVPLENRLATVDNPIGFPGSWQLAADLLAIASLALAFVALFVVIRAMVHRWQAGDELIRQQVLVFGIAFALPLLVLVLAATPASRPWMFALSTLPVPLAVAVAMFQRRLYDVQLAVTRTLTYVALSAVLAGLYALVVVGAGVMLQDRGAPWLPLVATAVVAVVFVPLRDWLQGIVNQLTYGRWAAPATVLADTGRRLADSADSSTLLDALTTEMVDGLGFSYAEIRDTSGRVLSASGSEGPSTDKLPLTAYGREVGELRWTGRPLNATDRTLLEALAHQIGGAVHTAGLVEELRDAQGRLVMAREQERRRLRSDLHDGLGPALAGLGFQLDAVQNLVADGQPVEDRLHRLRLGLSDTVVEVRRIVQGLRPPAVDDLGLFGAIAELGRELADGSGLAVTLELPEARPGLPAAVEVAAYRVTQEALTNVVRHARATRCRVSGSLTADALVIEVVDDGCGGARAGRGLGIPGMHHRAAEIGGAVEVSTKTRGTAVRLRLPVRLEVQA